MLFVAGACARAIVELAQNAGYPCLASDLFCDWDTRNQCRCHPITAFAELEELLKNCDYDELLIAGGMENFPDLVRRYSSNLPARDLDSLIRCRDPFTVAQLVNASPQFRKQRIGFPETLPQLNTTESHRGWLSKPRRSAGGTGVALLNPSRKIQSDQFVQRQIHGLSISALLVGDGSNCRLLGISRQLSGVGAFGSQGFTYCGSILINNLGNGLSDRIRQIGPVFVQEFGLRGVFGVDLIVESENLWILEINPRITASAEIIAPSLTQGKDIITEHLQGLAGKLTAPPLEHKSNRCPETHGKAVVYNRTHRSIAISANQFNSLKKWNQTNSAPSGIESKVADVPNTGSVIKPKWPIVTVITKAQNESETLQNLQTLAEDVYSIVENED